MQLPRPLREGIEQELSSIDGAQLRAAAARLSQRYRNPDAAAGAGALDDDLLPNKPTPGFHPSMPESGKPGTPSFHPSMPESGKLGTPGFHPSMPESGKLGTPGLLGSPLDRAAYLAVRMPATFAAIAAALGWTREAWRREAWGDEAPPIRSMLDLGSGPGTALWAAAQQFPTLRSAMAVERDPHLIEIGRRLAARSETAAVREAQWLCGDLASELPSGRWDLVICAYALNEIGEGHRARLIRQAWERTAKLLVIVEPGTRAGFANVLAVRSQMLNPDKPNAGLLGTTELDLEAQVAALIAPCPHSLACPMAAAGDWCHFAARVERSSLHRRLKDAELGHEDEKFSYVAFTREAQRKEAEIPPARIVRHPRIFSGYAQLTLCTEGRLEQATITRSHKEDWRRLKRLGWGDEW